MAATAAPAPLTMNGLGASPSPASTTASTSGPATATLISNSVTNPAPASNAPYPPSTPLKFSSSPSTAATQPHGNAASSSSSSSAANGGLPTTYTDSKSTKRKRADSSPVKDPQPVISGPPAQKQQDFAGLRQQFLDTLTKLDGGISLLDRPVSAEPNSHEAKKSRTATNTDGLQTLRQRLTSDTFYQSLESLRQDVTHVADEALEALGVAPDVAPEDLMRDDEDMHVKNETEDHTDLIRRFKQGALNFINQLSHSAQNNSQSKAPDSRTSPDLASMDDRTSSPFGSTPKSRQVIRIQDANKYFYLPLKDSVTLNPLDVPSRGQIVEIQQTPRTKPTAVPLETAFPNVAKPAPRAKVALERIKGLEAPDWLDYGPFSSFAPSSDQGRSTLSTGAKNQHWFSMHGEKELRKLRSGHDEDEDEEAEFKELAEKYEPIPIDPALFENESESEKALRTISDAICELNLKQEHRLIKHNDPNRASKPDSAETDLFHKTLNQIVDIIGKMDPTVVGCMDKMLELTPVLDNLPVSPAIVRGTMPDPGKAPPPPAPQPAAAYTTTRVSYTPQQGDGIFSPTARVVSNRSQGHNQYTNRSGSFSHQHFPQTPSRSGPTYATNTPYYGQQVAYAQPRQHIPATPQQYAAGGYANSPFSRNATATVPRMSTSAPHAGFVQQSNAAPPFQATIRQTSFVTQGSGHGQAQVQTGRRVSLAPQQPQAQTPVRPPSGQGQGYTTYTPGHNQYTLIGQQTQQQILSRSQQAQQAQQQQFHPHNTPGQQQFSYNQHVRQIQPNQQRSPFPPSGFPQTQVRIVQAPSGQPPLPR